MSVNAPIVCTAYGSSSARTIQAGAYRAHITDSLGRILMSGTSRSKYSTGSPLKYS